RACDAERTRSRTPVGRRPPRTRRVRASTSMPPLVDRLPHTVQGDDQHEADEVVQALHGTRRRLATLARPHLHWYLPNLQLPRGGQQQRLDGVGEILGRIRNGKSFDGTL